MYTKFTGKMAKLSSSLTLETKIKKRLKKVFSYIKKGFFQ